MVATTNNTNAQPNMEASQINNLPAAPAAAVISEQPVSSLPHLAIQIPSSLDTTKPAPHQYNGHFAS